MHYFFINILKIAMSAKALFQQFSNFSVCYNFVLKFHFIIHQFLLVGMQGLVLSLRHLATPRYDTQTTGFWKVCNYIELYRQSIKKR